MRLEEIVDQALRKQAGASYASDAFLSGHQASPRYAIGKNAETLAIHRLAPLDGIIDDYCKQGEHWHNIPLVRSSDARKDARVVNCSTSIRPIDTQQHLRNAGFRVIAGLGDVINAAGGALPWPAFVQAQRKELEDHLDAWQSIYEGMDDDVSKRTLVDVLQFRLTAELDSMQGYAVRVADQYFEEFMQYRNEVFVDAGGFDGDTSEAFATRYPDYRKILLFEPSARNMALARARLAAFRDIAFFPIGLSDAAGRLRFDPEGGSASAVTEEGGEQITVDALDAVVREPVTFIKMDLEGWELPALRGAKGHIVADRPKLAIAAYHGASDLRLICEFIQSSGHHYRMFLRHYTQGWSETVVFFRD